MVENKLQSGYINCMNKPYIFTYDGELLQLVPKDEESIKPYDSFKNKNIKKYLIIYNFLLSHLLFSTYHLPNFHSKNQ